MKFIISAILSLCINNVYAQKITGVITDRDNNPIEFATIVLQTTDSVFLNSCLYRFRWEIQYKNRYTSCNYNHSTSDVRNVSKKM